MTSLPPAKRQRSAARVWPAMLILAAMVWTAVPAAASNLWLEEDFEGGPDGLLTSIVAPLKALSDGHLGAGVKAVIPAGGNWGASGRWNFDDHGITPPEELYWRYYVKFPVGFYIEAPLRGKLPGPANLYTYNCLGNRVSTAAAPCWSARMLFSRDYSNADGNYQDGPSDKTVVGFYTYHLNSSKGDILTWDESVATLDHGRWYCLEGRIDLNTPGQRDGLLEGWVDGEPAFSRSDFAWRRSSEGALDVEMFWFDAYYGREGRPSKRNIEIQFDSLALGPERVGCDDVGTWDGLFSDDDGSVFEPAIEALAARGVTRGCNPPTNNRFCPDDAVSRAEMAAFLGRALSLPPVGNLDLFSDDNASVFESDIERLAASGVTRGCSPTTFCPESDVTRGQMAAFLVRAYGMAPSEVDYFTDDDGSIFEDAINSLAASGVTTGCTTTNFCPTDPVTRAQMAAFLGRADLL